MCGAVWISVLLLSVSSVGFVSGFEGSGESLVNCEENLVTLDIRDGQVCVSVNATEMDDNITSITINKNEVVDQTIICITDIEDDEECVTVAPMSVNKTVVFKFLISLELMNCSYNQSIAAFPPSTTDGPENTTMMPTTEDLTSQEVTTLRPTTQDFITQEETTMIPTTDALAETAMMTPEEVPTTQTPSIPAPTPTIVSISSTTVSTQTTQVVMMSPTPTPGITTMMPTTEALTTQQETTVMPTTDDPKETTMTANTEETTVMTTTDSTSEQTTTAVFLPGVSQQEFIIAISIMVVAIVVFTVLILCLLCLICKSKVPKKEVVSTWVDTEEGTAALDTKETVLDTKNEQEQVEEADKEPENKLAVTAGTRRSAW